MEQSALVEKRFIHTRAAMQSDVPLSRRRLEQIIAVIFDVHVIVTLINCYWRTDAEVISFTRSFQSYKASQKQIVHEILKQLPTRIIDDTVQAFVIATPKVRFASRNFTHARADVRRQSDDVEQEREAAQSQRRQFV